MEDQKLGLRSVISTSVGMVVATSCLVSLGSGAGEVGVTFIIAMLIACIFNMITMASVSELNALMPDTTGGLAQYTMVSVGPWPTMICMVGGYLLCSVLSAGVEATIFSYAVGVTFGLELPTITYTIIVTVILLIVNLYGIDLFAKVQDIVVYVMLGSMLFMGFLGIFGLGTGAQVDQPAVLSTDLGSILSMTGVAFWLFIGAEYAIPVSKNVKNAERNVPLGMMLGLLIICGVQSVMVLGFSNYTSWDELTTAAAPHLLYGMNLLGKPGMIWMTAISGLAVISTQNSSVHALAHICQGMAKMHLMPKAFGKTNRNGVPYVGVWFTSALILFFAAVSDGSAELISLLILVASIFWMISYIFIHIDVLVLRKRLPDAPRSFRVPGGPVLPIIGIAGTSYMVLNISTDPAQRRIVWTLAGLLFLGLGVYSFFWIRLKMHMPVLKSLPLHEVMAMEDPRYWEMREKKEAEERKRRELERAGRSQQRPEAQPARVRLVHILKKQHRPAV